MSQMLQARVAGPQDTIASCPFQSEEQVERLGPRKSPYWHHLLVGRHMGVHRPDGQHCNWTARLLTKDRRYVQKALGPALDLGNGRVSYLDAVQAAFAWFDTCASNGDVAEQAPRGRTDALCFCPTGVVYTVGHALHDYLTWSKIARSPGGHYNMITLINHHLTQGVSHVPLDQFTADHLKAIALQIIRTPPRHGFSKRVAMVERNDLSPDELRRRKRTYNSIVGILKVAFSYAWDAGRIETDRPLRCLKRISVVHTPRLLFLNRQECRALLANCTPALRQLVLAGLYSGCRVGELAELRVEDVGHQIFGLRMAAFKRSPARFVFLPDEGTISRQAPPLCRAEILKCVSKLGNSRIEVRDKAVLLVAADSWCRSSELAELRMHHMEVQSDGSAILSITRSKTDRFAKGGYAYLSVEAVEAVSDWQRLSQLRPVDPMFTTSYGNGCRKPLLSVTFTQIIRRVTGRRDVSSHSTRVGGVHDAMRIGCDMASIMVSGRWQSAEMPARYGSRFLVGQSAAAKVAARFREGQEN
jgi:integrase